MQRLICLTVFSILLSGCGVSSFKAQNWNTSESNDLYRNKNLEMCRLKAQLIKQDSSLDQNNNIQSRNLNPYANYNKQILTSCMEAKGYKLREITDEEVFINVVTIPLEVPLMILGKNYEDVY